MGPTDKDLVRQLLDRTTLYAIGADSRKVDVFLDTLRLEDGEHFRESFLEALVHSTVVVPVLSTTALHRMLTHKKDEVDNVLLEWICAIACKRLGLVQKVYPVVIGPWSEAEGVFLDMYAEGSLDRLSDEQPTATMSTAAQLLSTHGLALPKEVQVLTVRGVVQELNRFLGYLSWEQNRDVTGGPRMVRQCTEQLVHVLKSCSAAELPVETAVEETKLCVSESTAGSSSLSAADVYVDCERAWTMLNDPNCVQSSEAAKLREFMSNRMGVCTVQSLRDWLQSACCTRELITVLTCMKSSTHSELCRCLGVNTDALHTAAETEEERKGESKKEEMKPTPAKMSISEEA